MNQPELIFVDAVGTLFGVNGSVGQIYSQVASKFSVDVSRTLLEQAFYKNFKQAPPLAFPDIDSALIPAYEKQWWQAIAHHTFTDAGVIEQFADFDQFFDRLYAYFALGDPWFVYSDTIATLKYWQQQGIKLGIISNFDSRIYGVLDALNLTEFFATVTISSTAGAAKPSSEIFKVAIARTLPEPSKTLELESQAIWHIGDSFKEDYQGAIASGIRGIWLNRDRRDNIGDDVGVESIATLQALIS